MYTCSNDLRLTLNVGRAVSYVLSKLSWLLLEYDWTRYMYLRVLNLGVCVCPFVLVRYCSKVVFAFRQKIIDNVLPVLKATNHASAQVLIVFISMFSECAAPLEDSTTMYKLVSSANKRIDHPTRGFSPCRLYR